MATSTFPAVSDPAVVLKPFVNLVESIRKPKSKTLLECLTDQIVAGNLSVDDARKIVLRRQQRDKEEAINLPRNAAELAQLERKMILEAMRRHSDSVRHVAAELGLARGTIRRKLTEAGYRF